MGHVVTCCDVTMCTRLKTYSLMLRGLRHVVFVNKATRNVSKLNAVTNLYSEMNILYLIIEKKQAVEKALLFSYLILK